MKLLADVHISPRTAEFLRSLGHDVVRVPEVLPASAPDEVIIQHARQHEQVIVTQDLDFSALVALSGAARPSILSLRLASSRIEHVNEILQRVLAGLEPILCGGAIVSVEDHRIRIRDLPIRF
jgi:predicted nuclease of predicted toxin-antitoxin system